MSHADRTNYQDETKASEHQAEHFRGADAAGDPGLSEICGGRDTDFPGEGVRICAGPHERCDRRRGTDRRQPEQAVPLRLHFPGVYRPVAAGADRHAANAAERSAGGAGGGTCGDFEMPGLVEGQEPWLCCSRACMCRPSACCPSY